MPCEERIMFLLDVARCWHDEKSTYHDSRGDKREEEHKISSAHLTTKWSIRDEAIRFPQDCAKPRNGGGRLTHGGSRLPCGRQDLRHAGRRGQGLRQLDAHTGAASAICSRVAGSLPAYSWWMGTDGEYPHSAGEGERGGADWSSAHGLEASSGKEYGDEEEARSAERLSARGVSSYFVCSPQPLAVCTPVQFSPNEAAGGSFANS